MMHPQTKKETGYMYATFTHVLDISLADLDGYLKHDDKLTPEHVFLRLAQIELEHTCIPQGLVLPNTMQLVEYTNVMRENMLRATLSLKCDVFLPSVGETLTAVVRDITKMGIRCESTHATSTFQAIIMRDHLVNKKTYHDYKVDDVIEITVLRYTVRVREKFIGIIAKPA